MKHVRSLPLPWAIALACNSETPLAVDASTSSGEGGSSHTAAVTVAAESDTSSSSSVGSEDGDVTSGIADDSSDAASSSSTSGPVDAPPIAVDDLYRTPMDGALEVAAIDGLFANDVDAETAWLTLLDADAESARGGTVVVDTEGGFTYTPPMGAWGPDSFGYTAIDTAGQATSATTTINVLPIEIPLSELVAGHGGYTIEGVASSQSAFSLAGAGDVDGDGIDDVLIGSPFVYDLGRVHVVFGKADHDDVSLADISSGTGGFRIVGAVAVGHAGWDVAGAGDVNGDGLDDIVIAEPGPVYGFGNETVEFSVYVVFGKADTAEIDLADVAAGTGGFVLTGLGQPIDFETRLAVAGAGDVNDDGLADLAVACPAVPDTGLLRSWIVFGKADTDPVALDGVAAANAGFVIEGDVGDGPTYCPQCIDGAGDVDGDGADDIVIGWQQGGVENRGRAYVVLGKPDSDPVDLGTIATGVGGFAIEGAAPNDFLGEVVAGAGDVDGDGLSDLIFGLQWDQDEDGRAFVVFGKADTDPVALADVTAGVGGFAILGDPDSRLGVAVAGGRDIDGDGLDDIVLGSDAITAVPSQGRAYVVYGKADGAAVELGTTMDGSLGYWLDAQPGFYNTSHAVAIAGDVDADGLADVVLSAYTADDFAGRTYVLAGTSKAPEPD